MKKRWKPALLAGWWALSWGAESRLLAADPALGLAQPRPSGRGEEPVPAAALGLTSIFDARGQLGMPFLAEGSRFQRSGNLRTSTLPVSSVASIRALLRDYFYHNLKLGVATLDRTLAELGRVRGLVLHLSSQERRELSASIDLALRPLLIRYHTAHVNHQRLFDNALSLAQAREQVYQQMFRYLAEGISNPTMRAFMRTHFEPAGSASPFTPRPDVRAEFLRGWTKHFQQQPLGRSFPPALPLGTWQGLLVAYHREITYFHAELLPEPSERVRRGVETFLPLLLGWAPLDQFVEPRDRGALRKIAAMPSYAEEAQGGFGQDLLAVARSEEQLPGRNTSAQQLLRGTAQALRALRQRSDFLQAMPAGEVRGTASREGRQPVRAAFRPLFAVGSPVANLWKELDTATFAGLLGAQTLRRLEHSTAVMEATLAAMGIAPQDVPTDRVGRLTELLCEGYQQYPSVATSEPKILTHLRRLEEAYWHEVNRSYPDAVLQGKFTSGFLPTEAATQDFLREFSAQAKGKVLPPLTLAETQLLQQTLPRLETKEGVAEVVHLLLARGAGYHPSPLPALAQVQLHMQEYELHPCWVSQRNPAMVQLIRELAALSRTHPEAPDWEPVQRLLQPLGAVGFGQEVLEAASGQQQPGEAGSFALPGSREGAGSQEAPPLEAEEGRRSAEPAASPAGRESPARAAEGHR